MLKIRLNPWLNILALFASPAFCQTPNCGCEQKPQLNVLAVVNGVKITQQDLSIDTKTNVSLVQETVITARAQELDLQINRMLLAAEAKRRNLPIDTLIVLEIKARVPEPTEADARAFYEQYSKRIGRSFGSVKKDIIARLRSERENLRSYLYANALRAIARVTVSKSPVTPPANEADLARVFATVDGVNITSKDIEESLLPLISMVQQQVYQIRKRDLDIRINDLLLSQEAKRLGMTPETLINLNVRSRMHIVNDEQARAYYKEQKANIEGSFSENKFAIMRLLQTQEEQKQVAAYAEELRKGAAVQVYLVAPAKR